MLLEPDDRPNPKPISDYELQRWFNSVVEKETKALKKRYDQLQERIKANERRRQRA